MTQSDLTNRSRGQAATVRSLAGHALWNYGALAIQLGGSFALMGLAFRRLSPAEVGAFSLVAVTAGLLQILDPAAGFVMSRVAALEHAGRATPRGRQLVAQMRGGLLTVAVTLTSACALVLVTLFAVGAPRASSGVLVMSSLMTFSVSIQLATAHWPATAVAVGDYRTVCASSAITSVATLVIASLVIGPIGIAGLGLAQLIGQVLGRATFMPRYLHGPYTDGQRLALGFGSLVALRRHAGAIYLSSLAAQFLAVSDLWTVGVLKGAGASAAYRAGSLPPSQGSALFYRLYDVLYPRLPQLSRPAEQERAVWLATRVFSAAAGCLFTVLWVVREPLIRLLVGQPDALSEEVFTVFCAIWLVNVPIHGLALLLLSRGQQKILTPVAVVEAVVNIVVSVVLVVLLGPIGAAIGTLATMAVSNVIIMPWIVEGLVPRARRMVGIGFGWCVAAVGLTLIAQAPLALSLDGPAATCAACGTGVVSLGVTVWLAAGRDGRRVLRANV